ncbi:MAG: translational GTPase TypA [Clostridiales bacterium]|nr:MAG: translational GTPase TypA [Clostridiales bacterium]
MKREDLRNIAIIAHVDHGKTTLVNEMLRQGGVFRSNQVVEDRVMDSNDIERERGITILAKNTSAFYKGVKINIVDTPGHADFGGEVERVLKMVNGVVLLVDAFDGPMPQTRFVLQKALELNHKVIIVVNKIDRPDARPEEVTDEVLELLLELDATDEQLDSPVIYCSGRAGTASTDPYTQGEDLQPLFETILTHIDAPEGDPESPLQVLVSSIEYNDYVGRLAIGRIENGVMQKGMEVALIDYHDQELFEKAKINTIYQFAGLKRETVESAKAGDIVCFSGISDVNIGNTVCAVEKPEAIPFVKISEPTVEMTFSVNNSPFAGKEGSFVTSRHLRDRLFGELKKDVSLRVEETDSPDSFRVLGRGEMHLSILIENMRREGFELQVSSPKVLFKTVDGQRQEPMERLVCDVPSDAVGSVIEKIGSRKGEMVHMHQVGERIRLEFLVPSRGLFGYSNDFMTDTKGEGIMSTIFEGYAPYKGEIAKRSLGSLIAHETGEAVTYGLFNAQDRGTMFITPGTPVYAGMIVGCSPKAEDIVVNVCKKKHVTNMRAAGSDEALRLTPPRIFSLEECLEFIGDDELVEVTPKSLRLRKRILDHTMRMRAQFNKKNQ